MTEKWKEKRAEWWNLKKGFICDEIPLEASFITIPRSFLHSSIGFSEMDATFTHSKYS